MQGTEGICLGNQNHAFKEKLLSLRRLYYHIIYNYVDLFANVLLNRSWTPSSLSTRKRTLSFIYFFYILSDGRPRSTLPSGILSEGDVGGGRPKNARAVFGERIIDFSRAPINYVRGTPFSVLAHIIPPANSLILHLPSSQTKLMTLIETVGPPGGMCPPRYWHSSIYYNIPMHAHALAAHTCTLLLFGTILVHCIFINIITYPRRLSD